MTDNALGQSVPNGKAPEGLFLMDGIEGLRSLPRHSVDMLLTDPPYGTTESYSLGELFKQRLRAVLCKAYRKGSLPTKMVWLPLFSGLERLALVVSKNTLIQRAPILFGLVQEGSSEQTRQARFYLSRFYENSTLQLVSL